jgi:hypothetical protein
MKVRIIQFAAAILTALALVPGGAHVLELSNKINLDQAQYVAVQQIYRGWALLGIVLIAALLANLLSAIVARSQKMPVLFAATATVRYAQPWLRVRRGKDRRLSSSVAGRGRAPRYTTGSGWC